MAEPIQLSRGTDAHIRLRAAQQQRSSSKAHFESPRQEEVRPMPAKSFPRGIRPRKALTIVVVSTLALAAGWPAHLRAEGADDSHDRARGQTFDQRVRDNAIDAFKQGRHTFRFDTFGDEDF